jgi:probable HAF family extracellular repeat protein
VKQGRIVVAMRRRSCGCPVSDKHDNEGVSKKGRTMSQPMSFIATCLLAVSALPMQLAAQSNYTFTEVPTLGGPIVYGNATGAKDKLLNSVGTMTGGADTDIADPFCSNAPDCFAEHAFTFRKGMLTDLGVLPGGFNSQAFWINDSGTAVGLSQIGVPDPLIPNFFELRAALWQNGKTVAIGTFGGNDSVAQAVNNRGQVVGFALNSIPDSMSMLPWPTEMRAFLWDKGVLQNLGTLGGPDSWAMFVNDRGQVAGISYPDSNLSSACDTAGNNHVFLWENGQMKDLGTLGGSCSWPERLSDQGLVVGWSNVAGDTTQHPFLWDGTKLLDLGTLGGSCGYATGINDTGEVIGVSCTENDETFLAFAWKSGVMTTLPPLPGDCASDARRINSKGQIIGASYPCDFSSMRGVLWGNGTVTDLNSFVPLDSGFDIIGDDLFLNDRGEIAGNGVTPNGDIHFFTLTPVSGSAATSASATVAALRSPSTNTVHTKLGPDVLAKLRAHITPYHNIPGLPARN